MLTRKSSQLVASLIIATTLVSGLPTVSQAQSNPGFSFIQRDDNPSPKQSGKYWMKYGQAGARRDTYQLLLRRQAQPVDSIMITFPDYYIGKYKASNIQLIALSKRTKKVIALKGVKTTKDQRQVQIIPETPIPAQANLMLRLNDVQNPTQAGVYPVTATITSPGDVPLERATTMWQLQFTQ